MKLSDSGVLFSAALLVVMPCFHGCGFHLRGTQAASLPPALAVMRVTVEGSRAAHDPLLVAMQNALRTQAGVTLTTDEVPTLILSDERIESRVLSVGNTGKVNEYLIRYIVGFRVNAADGRPLTEPQAVALQRDYTFDQREEEELRRALREDAVQQILRRLARIPLKQTDVAGEHK
jgi:LPS-assembly lipoprotein